MHLTREVQLGFITKLKAITYRQKTLLCFPLYLGQ